MTRVREFERLLVDDGFTVEWLSQERTWALAFEWGAVFGAAWEAGCRMRTGYRALNEYAQQSAGIFHLLPQDRRSGGPPGLGGRSGLGQGLECRGEGPLPDLSRFAGLEFSVSPPDLAWTLVHTHEDHALGGPYFVRREWAEAGRRPHSRR